MITIQITGKPLHFLKIRPPIAHSWDRKSLVPSPLQKYGDAVRLVANTLLVLFVAVGLVLPNALGRTHEVACSGGDQCEQMVVTSHQDAEPCQGCPPPDDCPCDHGEDQEEAPLDQEDSKSDHNEDCPLHEHHHHHHQCVCSSASAGLIADASSLSFHPPVFTPALAVGEKFFIPDPPVYLLDRPPAP